MKFQRPKGTEDLYGSELIIFNNIISRLTQVAKNYHFQEIITPIFEATQLFLRSIGKETDIIAKEIYQFLDKSGRDLALRPEGTAGVIRAVIENKLYNNQKQTLKYFYQGSMYRYERPQKGRNREFHQFGIEAIGTKHPLLDAEIILLALNMIKQLEIPDVILNLNFFGSETTKQAFQKALTKALTKQKTKLCHDCQARITDNPLRVLDCKTCQNLNLELPKLAELYSLAEKTYFTGLTNALDQLNVAYVIDYKLVRGLDYYNGMIFEITTNDPSLGKSQNTLVGGGRYDNLCQELGLPYPYPAVGFAFGIERLMLLLQNNVNFSKQTPLDLYLISQDETSLPTILMLLNQLRNANYLVEGNFNIFNDKQKSSLLNNLTNVTNILVLNSHQQATLYQKTQGQKVTLTFASDQELLTNIMKYLK